MAGISGHWSLAGWAITYTFTVKSLLLGIGYLLVRYISHGEIYSEVQERGLSQ
jgi:hypothetical protein